MKIKKSNSREKILAAAADVAREAGPGNLSLEAVASRAGVSKGGLLYNFPSKAKLMQALVEEYLGDFQQAMETARAQEPDKSLLATYLRLSAQECDDTKDAASWIFSAIAEDPDFLTPLKTFKRQLFAQLKAETPNLKALLVTYLAMEGLRSLSLFEIGLLAEDERQVLIDSLLEIANG
ncbi:TetR family transcriptional regulator [Mesorhizobium sp. Root157]|uniref:TetR/AcrR family transcriptional regulator n=1 Tax=Mesorhizobium sp. Root157 TaxID=1736477 RepID=UPI0006F62518|nr:TetR/AcrR family transcriptional regulator [Mesorhizobium sp. Root157]KQZ79144.1 TetR family transcriptional regulator [Mesorhizobium sp. Root157]